MKTQSSENPFADREIQFPMGVRKREGESHCTPIAFFSKVCRAAAAAARGSQFNIVVLLELAYQEVSLDVLNHRGTCIPLHNVIRKNEILRVKSRTKAKYYNGLLWFQIPSKYRYRMAFVYASEKWFFILDFYIIGFYDAFNDYYLKGKFPIS